MHDYEHCFIDYFVKLILVDKNYVAIALYVYFIFSLGHSIKRQYK